jgi:hypothetical protein
VTRLIAILGLLLSLSAPSFAADLKSHLIFDTGGVACGGPGATANVMNWTNNTGATMYVRQVQVFQGMDLGGVGDFSFQVIRMSDASVMAFTNWDHYADPTAQHDKHYSYQPDYMAIAPGGVVALVHRCSAPTTIHVQVVVRFWTSVGP